MERAIYLATCVDKSHRYDSQIVSEIKQITGIREVSAVPDMKIKGSTYCIIARAKVTKTPQLRSIYSKIAKQNHLKSVKQLTAKQ